MADYKGPVKSHVHVRAEYEWKHSDSLLVTDNVSRCYAGYFIWLTADCEG